jgi:RNA polymerase sigma-70 factor (ECF subfamily)
MSMPIESAMSDAKEFVSESAEPNPETDLGESCATDARFFDQHAPSVTRYAMSIVRRWADAEEITQEAFCKLLTNRTVAKVESNSEAKAILFTTVRNLSIDRLRKQSKRKFEPIDAQTIATPQSGHSKVGLEQLEAGISQAMDDLPEEWSEALQLKVNGGLSYDEIAKVLSASHNQIRTWIYRARKQLQADLKQAGLLGEES